MSAAATATTGTTTRTATGSRCSVMTSFRAKFTQESTGNRFSFEDDFSFFLGATCI